MTPLKFFQQDGALVGAVTIFPPKGAVGAIAVISEEEARRFSEERVQILEDTRYEYEVSPPELRLATTQLGNAIRASENPKLAHCGVIDTGPFVGRLGLALVDSTGHCLGTAGIEVQSRKLGYRDDFRTMLEEITERSVALAFELRSPTTLRALPEPADSIRTLYQQFAFLRGLLGSREFLNALRQVVSRPHERLEDEPAVRDLRQGTKPTAGIVRLIARSPRRVPVPATHPLSGRLRTLPASICLATKARSDDTQENQFVRFALEHFSAFLGVLSDLVVESGRDEHKRLRHEATNLRGSLEDFLSAPVLANASELDRIPLDSPALQRREGYREVLQAWLKFDLAARLVWDGADDLYEIGQQDVATLYEYWVFFKLLALIETRFSIDPAPSAVLVEETGDRLGLRLKAGRSVTLRGITSVRGSKIQVRLDYNRTFSRVTPVSAYSGERDRRIR